MDLDNLLGSIAAKPVPAAPSFGGAGITQQAQFGGGPAGGASGGTDDFSDFAAAPTAASMGPSSGFGDFTTAPAQAGASSGGLGDFSAPTMSASGGTTAPPAAEGSDDFGAFSGTVDASESAKSGGAVQEEPPKPTVSIDDLVANVATEIGSNSPASARKKFEKKKKTLATARKIERKVKHGCVWVLFALRNNQLPWFIRSTQRKARRLLEITLLLMGFFLSSQSRCADCARTVVIKF